jgi:hypothetical protein
MAFCDQCGNQLKETAKFCNKCGAKVDAGGGGQYVPTATVCSQCGAPLEAGEGFCANCGAKVIAGRPIASTHHSGPVQTQQSAMNGQVLKEELLGYYPTRLFSGGAKPGKLSLYRDRLEWKGDRAKDNVIVIPLGEIKAAGRCVWAPILEIKTDKKEYHFQPVPYGAFDMDSWISAVNGVCGISKDW